MCVQRAGGGVSGCVCVFWLGGGGCEEEGMG